MPAPGYEGIVSVPPGMPAPGYDGSFDVLIGVMAGLSAGRGGCRYGEDGTAEAVRPPALYCVAAAAGGELCAGDDAAPGEGGCGRGWAGFPPGNSAHADCCPSDASWCSPAGCKGAAVVAGPSWSSEEAAVAAGPSGAGGTTSDGGAAEGGEAAGASSAGTGCTGKGGRSVRVVTGKL